MGKSMMAALVVLLAAGAAVPAVAQTPGRTLGLGVGIQPTVVADDDDGALGVLAPQFYVPIAMSETLLLEPSFGVFRISQHQETGTDRFEFRATALRFGAGLLFLSDAGPDGRLYFGPRVGLIRFSASEESPFGESDYTQLNLALAGVAGGEFFLRERFSLGGELGLEYIRVGDPDRDDEPSGFEEGGSFLRTIAEVRVRWYFR